MQGAKQVPCYICGTMGPETYINLNTYKGHGICANCEMYYVRWLKRALTPYQEGCCVHCMTPLTETDKEHEGWNKTLLHEKCWMKLKKQDEDDDDNWLEELETQVKEMREAFKNSQCYADMCKQTTKQ